MCFGYITTGTYPVFLAAITCTTRLLPSNSKLHCPLGWRATVTKPGWEDPPPAKLYNPPDKTLL